MITRSELYDLIIIGSGPAGLSAGIYGGRASLKTLILEKSSIGGRAYTTREIVNYPGVPNSSGPTLMASMEEQVKQFGTEIIKEQVKKVDFSNNIKSVFTRKHEYLAKTVILATGTSSRILGIPGEKELAGQGVAYCATCDAEFFKNQEVVVVGSGDQAIEESIFIAKFAAKVTIIVLHEEGILDCNKLAAEKAMKHPKLNFIWNSILSEVSGTDEVTGVKIKNIKTCEITDYPCQGVFFFVGMVPATSFLNGAITVDDRGWIHTSEKMETSVEGVYAVGDVRNKYLRQVSTAINDGAIAATAAERYIEEQETFEDAVNNSDKPIILAFWNPEFTDSLSKINLLSEQNSKLGYKYNILEIDITRKQSIGKKYDISLTQKCPAAAIILQGNIKTKNIDFCKLLNNQL